MAHHIAYGLCRSFEFLLVAIVASCSVWLVCCSLGLEPMFV